MNPTSSRLVVILVVVSLLLAIGAFRFFEAFSPTASPATSGALQSPSPAAMGKVEQPRSGTSSNSFEASSPPNPYQSRKLDTDCAPPFDETTTLGSTLFEIAGNSLYVGGVERIASIPGSLGLPPSNDGIGFQDPNTNPCVGPSSGVPTSTFTYDRYTNIGASSDGTQAAFIYFRDEYTSQSYRFVTQFATLLRYSRDGVLVSSTTLRQWSDAAHAYEPYTDDGTVVYVSGAAVYVDVLDGKGGDFIQEIEGGIANRIIDPTRELYSPTNRYLVYTPAELDGIVTNCAGPLGGTASDLKVMDFMTGASTTIISDLSKAFDPIAWSGDQLTVLILIGNGDSRGCFTQNTNYMTYNLATRQVDTNASATNILAALSDVCARQDFDCSNMTSWFQ